MGNNLNKFLLLMWKNFLLQYRRPLQAVIEILAPVIFSILLVVIRGTVTPEVHDRTLYDEFDLLANATSNNSAIKQIMQNLQEQHRLTLLYAPDLPNVNALMKCYSPLYDLIGFETEEEMLNHYTATQDNSTFAALHFSTKDNFDEDNVVMKIRFPSELRTASSNPLESQQNNWKTNLIYPIFQTPGPRSFKDNYGATPSYYKERFLLIQYVTSYLIMYRDMAKPICSKLKSDLGFDEYNYRNFFGLIDAVNVTMKRFPYGKWTEDLLLQPLISLGGLLIMLSFVYTCINIVKSVTAEKEKQLKESMKIMGLPNWLHWTAWFIKSFTFLFISTILMVVFLKANWYNSDITVFTHADPTVMLVFFTLYISATITFSFMISVFFSKANTASTVAGLLWFLSYSPYLFMQSQYDSITQSTKLLSSLGSNSAMAYGFQLMLMFEGTGEGVQWSNIAHPNTEDDNLTLLMVMGMLVLDIFIYLFIALYVEAVFPGEYGVPLPWYFPFTAKYWCGEARSTGVGDIEENQRQDSEFYEKEPENLDTGIQIRGLRKVFNKKVAVRNLHLNMYRDQITVLLGHNGAGKTTTMSMLTGMFTPSSGTAIISGYDIRTNMNGVRESMGLCPQHNIIFDDLTVSEHLYFFSKLKGMSGSAIKQEIDKYVELLELEPKRNARASTLSGGMKRKLCVGMALCANSKVVMLDEPTAGMDPSARRALWELLQSQKKGRTMLLTTHFMDEADLLGDRIAIMAGGELQCCGSSFFLKKKYGAGYHLIMDKSEECDSSRVTSLLRKHIPNIEINSDIGSELSYLLVENQASVFENMLQDLENHSNELGIRSFGISLTTLEEVFMKVGADHGQEEMYNNELQGLPPINDQILENKDHLSDTRIAITDNNQFLTGFDLLLNQVYSMVMKRILSICRNWILQLLQIFIPVVFLIIAIIVIRTQKQTGDLPAMPLTLDKFSDPHTLVQGSDSYSDAYKNLTQNVEVVDDIEQRMINLSTALPRMVRQSYIIGADFSQTSEPFHKIVAYFNNDPYHSPAIALGYVINAIYKTKSKQTLEFINEPLPYTAESKAQQLATGQNMGFNLAFNIGFSMAFVSSFYVIFYVKERISKSKHLQFVSGVKVYVFWPVSYIIDLVTFMVTAVALIITLLCFQEDGFKTADEIGRIFLTLFYFGWSMLPMIYLASFFFDIPSTGYTRMSMFSIFTGNAAFIVIQILGTPGFNLEHIAKGLHWLFLLVPHYSLSSGLKDIYTLYAYNQICAWTLSACEESGYDKEECRELINNNTRTAFCKDTDNNYYKWEAPGIGRNLLFSFTVGIVLFAILILNEYKIFTIIFDKIKQILYKTPSPTNNENEDEDVKAEKLKIRNTPVEQLFTDNTLVLRDLTKYYKQFLAVNSLCLGVKRYECFGLLGINGAGKTTTFKMMTGDIEMSSGNAWVNGLSLKTNIKQVQKLIGYCPQFDALLDDLTARETLLMFGLLRGVHYKACGALAVKLAKDFDFHRHLDKKVKELSGGNKRKLSTALALIGDPPVLYLDEPTTGMDVATKRYLWNVLNSVRDNGKCIVLTSHSMEECEALCTRLAIMVNGEFKCLGSTQHLKNKFAAGYSLTIKLKKMQNLEHADTGAIEAFIAQHFPGAQLREKHEELITYYITGAALKWSQMFGILERAKRQDLNIEDYSLGQSSLEQVFLTFTKNQR